MKKPKCVIPLDFNQLVFSICLLRNEQKFLHDYFYQYDNVHFITLDFVSFLVSKRYPDILKSPWALVVVRYSSNPCGAGICSCLYLLVCLWMSICVSICVSPPDQTKTSIALSNPHDAGVRAFLIFARISGCKFVSHTVTKLKMNARSPSPTPPQKTAAISYGLYKALYGLSRYIQGESKKLAFLLWWSQFLT